MEIVQRKPPLRTLNETVVEESRCKAHDVVKRLCFTRRCLSFWAWRWERDASPVSEKTYSFREGNLLVLHDKGEDVATYTASKAVVDLLIRTDGERRCLF